VERNGMGDGLRGGVEADGAVERVRLGARKGFFLGQSNVKRETEQ